MYPNMYPQGSYYPYQNYPPQMMQQQQANFMMQQGQMVRPPNQRPPNPDSDSNSLPQASPGANPGNTASSQPNPNLPNQMTRPSVPSTSMHTPNSTSSGQVHSDNQPLASPKSNPNQNYSRPMNFPSSVRFPSNVQAGYPSNYTVVNNNYERSQQHRQQNLQFQQAQQVAQQHQQAALAAQQQALAAQQQAQAQAQHQQQQQHQQQNQNRSNNPKLKQENLPPQYHSPFVNQKNLEPGSKIAATDRNNNQTLDSATNATENSNMSQKDIQAKTVAKQQENHLKILYHKIHTLLNDFSICRINNQTGINAAVSDRQKMIVTKNFAVQFLKLFKLANEISLKMRVEDMANCLFFFISDYLCNVESVSSYSCFNTGKRENKWSYKLFSNDSLLTNYWERF